MNKVFVSILFKSYFCHPDVGETSWKGNLSGIARGPSFVGMTEIADSNSMIFLLKNARIIDPQSAHNGQTLDVLIENGLIRQLSPGLSLSADVRVIEGENLHLSPGWVDLRVSAKDPGFEHQEDLTSVGLAAAAGGFTDIAVLPNTKPVIDTKNAVGYIRRMAEGQPVSVHPIAAITRNTAGDDFADMLDLHQAGAIAFSDGAHPLQSPDLIIKTLQYLRPVNGLLMNRPEDATLARYGQMHEGVQSTLLGLRGIPALAEEIVVERDLRLLDYVLADEPRSVGAEPILHFSCLSSARSVALIRDAKAAGLPVSCDVAAHQLVFTDAALSTFDTNLKVNPPFRSAADRDALWAGLTDGTIDAIVSDHNPQDEESKNIEFDQAEFGITGLETVFAAVMSQPQPHDLNRIIDALTIGPRRLLRLPPVAIAEGEPATLTLFDPAGVWTFDKTLSKSRNSPFFGQSLTGKVLGTFRHGQFTAASPEK
jgi:dihydroorotase